jgi:hypothetical protein
MYKSWDLFLVLLRKHNYQYDLWKLVIPPCGRIERSYCELIDGRCPNCGCAAVSSVALSS